jgi:internalin A
MSVAARSPKVNAHRPTLNEFSLNFIPLKPPTMAAQALTLIAENIRTKNPVLDLGNCGLAVLYPALLEELAKTGDWLEELILSNEWRNVTTGDLKKSQNGGMKNNLQVLPAALPALPKLKSLVLEDQGLTDCSALAALSTLQSLNISKNKISNYAFLVNLVNLHTLNLSTTQINDCAPLASLKNLQQLYIYENQISDCTPLANLVTLQQLYIYDNQISDCTPLADLVSLQQLSISHNKISDCAPLAKLVNLQELYISHNQINDCAPLAKLVNLQQLYIIYNKISDCSPLANLYNLQELSIYKNQVSNCAPLANLVNLQNLDISDNQISDCSPLANLFSLQYLDISNNQISDCIPLANLNNLQQLYIYGNQISDCAPLSNLVNLQRLYISYNKISDCTPLANLNNLQELYIYSNQISDCAPLSNLVNLQRLDIAFNQIGDCAPLLPLIKKGMEIKLSNGNESGLYLYDNPITNPPMEILEQGNEAVIRYFESLEKDKKQGKPIQQVRELKLIFLGEGESGKTTLMKRLQGIKVIKGEKQTQGITQMTWTIPDEKGEIKANLWDFGGQEIQHNAHQFFLTEDCIYILLLDNRRDEQPEYWLQHILSLGKNSPVLVVSNKVDIPAHATDRFNQELLRTKYNIHGFYKVSALQGTNIDRLKEDLLHLISNFSFPNFGSDWIEVKNYIEQETALGKNFIIRQQLHQYCGQKVQEQDEIIILNYLKKIGKVSFHTQNMNTRDFYILNPEWLIYAIYKITLSDKTILQKGEIVLDDFEEMLKPNEEEPLFELRKKYVYERAQYGYLLEMMKEYHLCYTADSERIIIPSAFPETHTAEFVPYAESLHFYLQYADFLPPSIISQFIARMFQYKKGNRYWHSGMELLDAETGSHALVQLDKEPKRIYITVNGEQRRVFFDFIRRELKTINGNFDRMRVDERIPLPSKEKDQSVGYTQLINHELDGKESYYHSDTRENFSVRELLAGIEPFSATMTTLTTRRQMESKESIERFNNEIDKLANVVATMSAPATTAATQQPSQEESTENVRLKKIIEDAAVRKWKRIAATVFVISLLVTAIIIYLYFTENKFIMSPEQWKTFKSSDKAKLAGIVLAFLWNVYPAKMFYDRILDPSKEKAYRDNHKTNNK